GSCPAIPDHVPPAVVCPQPRCGTALCLLLAGRCAFTQVMDEMRDERPPAAMPRPARPQPPRAASLAQQVYRLQRGGCIVLAGYRLADGLTPAFPSPEACRVRHDPL